MPIFSGLFAVKLQGWLGSRKHPPLGTVASLGETLVAKMNNEKRAPFCCLGGFVGTTNYLVMFHKP